MTGLVFLRTSFGYAFLGPKSIFLACIWAQALFTFYAWHEPGAWPHWRAVALFGVAASLLYLCHLLKAFGRELRRSGKHDYYAGTPHFMRLAALFRTEARDKIEAFTYLWLEPALVLIAATLFSIAGVAKLPFWLVLLSLSLWSKEAINYWYRLRHQKKQSDVFSDAGESLDHYPGSSPAGGVTGAGRKPRQKRERAVVDTGTDQGRAIDRYAEILRLMPPYSLEQAETNYRALMRGCHPDTAGSDPDASKRASELTEALDFFRGQHRSA